MISQKPSSEDKEGLITFLDHNHGAFAAMLDTIPEDRFFEAASGKWSAAQQLDHLTKAVGMVNLALRLPPVIPSIIYGKPKRTLYTYEQVVDQYKSKLSAGAKASGIYLPSVASKSKQELLRKFKSTCNTLTQQVGSKSEHSLDSVQLPHPIIGKLTVREMLFFTGYHVLHHHQSLLLDRNNK